MYEVVVFPYFGIESGVEVLMHIAYFVDGDFARQDGI